MQSFSTTVVPMTIHILRSVYIKFELLCISTGAKVSKTPSPSPNKFPIIHHRPSKMVYLNLPSLLTINIILHAFGTLAQMITPAPVGPGRYAQINKRLRTDASFLASAMNVCWSTGGACGSAQINLNYACSMEYQGSFDYLWCLCTTGYYDSLHKYETLVIDISVSQFLILMKRLGAIVARLQ